MQGFWASETSEPPNEGRTTTPTLPPPGPFRSPAIGGPDVVDTFTAAVNRWGTPASVLTDNGAIFTATPRRGGRTALQVMLGELSINYLSCRRYQPDLQGRALPQTLKKAPAGPTRSGHRHRPATPYRRFPGLLQQHSPAPRAVPPARPSSVP